MSQSLDDWLTARGLVIVPYRPRNPEGRPDGPWRVRDTRSRRVLLRGVDRADLDAKAQRYREQIEHPPVSPAY